MLLILATGGAFAAQPSALTLPVAGNFADAVGGTGTFTGQYHITNFSTDAGKLLAQGYVTGTLTDSTGRAIGSVMKAITLPVSLSQASSGMRAAGVQTAATCPILHLDLGPISLDLLGLQVNLSEVVLDISAQSGSGNLLGNLLCAITHLLDGAGALVDIANLLNQILSVLSGLLG